MRAERKSRAGRRKRKPDIMESPVFYRIWLKKLAVVLCIVIVFTALGTYFKFETFCNTKKEEYNAFIRRTLDTLETEYDTLQEVAGAAATGIVSGEQGILDLFSVSAGFTISTQGYPGCAGMLLLASTGEKLAGPGPENAMYVFLREKGGGAGNAQIYMCADENVLREAGADYWYYCGTLQGQDEAIVQLQPEELYLKNGYFVPGSMQLTATTRTADEIVLKEYDYTPEDTGGYTYVDLRNGETEMLLHPVCVDRSGMRDTISFLESRYAAGGYTGYMRDDCMDKPVQYFFGGIQFVEDRIINVAGLELCFVAAGSFNMFQEYKTVLSICYAAILLLAVMLSLGLAYHAYMVQKSQYDMEQYRREKTDAIAHDLKTPLTVITGYAQNLLDNVHTDKREHYVQEILGNVEYMNKMIGNILSLSRLESAGRTLELANVDLRSMTEEILAQYEILLGKKQNTVEIEGGAFIKADTAQFKQALENLISNSVKYASAASVIRIIISPDCYEIRNQFSGELGISAQELWKPFVRGDNSRSNQSGTGIGLTIVKNILDMHGYALRLKEEDGVFVAELRLC